MTMKKIIFSVYLFFLIMGVMLIAQKVKANSAEIKTSCYGNIAAGTACPGATNVKVYQFELRQYSFGSTTFTNLNNIKATGSYVASDLINLKLWTATCGGATSTLLATITTPAASGVSMSFPAFSSTITNGDCFGCGDRFVITADFAAGAVAGHTFQLNKIDNSMAVVATGLDNGATNNAAGAQTICALPVELYSFTGENSEEKNILEWVTASEINNDFFTIEKSDDGIYFHELIKLNGAGSSSTFKNYFASDDDPYPDITYYRLKQTDFNGDFTYSPVISVRDFPLLTVSLAPNPVQNDVHLNFSSEKEMLVQADVINSFGQCVISKSIPLPEGAGFIDFDTGIISRGMYLFKIGNGFFQRQIKFLKL